MSNLSPWYRVAVWPELDFSIWNSIVEAELPTHSNARNVPIVVHQSPLVAYHVKSKYMVVHLVCILVEAAEGIDLVVSAIRDRGINKARRSLAQSSRYLGTVAITITSALSRRIGHEKGIIRRSSGARGWNTSSRNRD